MASYTKWTPFGVALDIDANSGGVSRISATKFTVIINASWNTTWNGALTNYGMSASSGGVTRTISEFNGTKRSNGSATFTGTYSINSNGAATKTITVTFRNFNTDNGDSATKSLSFNVNVPAWTSYTVTYNANGGAGAPGSQTKWKDQTLTLSSTKPTRTGYSFLGWATTNNASSATYSAGGSYTNNSSATLYAVWKANTYAVNYNANGGTGAPDKQTKTYGVTLTLSTTVPTRTNYTFKGWGTSVSATTVSYSAGGSYTTNAAVTLYAIWELSYIKPRINNLTVMRCDENGKPSDDGLNGLINFAWECDREVSSIVIGWSSDSTESGSVTLDDISGTSGHIINVFGNNNLSSEVTYTIVVNIEDTNGYSYAFTTLSGTKFVIDFLAGGTGAAFNKPAELEGVLDIGFKTRHFGGLLPVVLEPETDLNDVFMPNTYTGANISEYNYANCPSSSGTFTLIVDSCGEDGQIRQTYISCSKYKPERYVRFYYQLGWGEWFWAGTEEYVLYENASGNAGTISLDASLSHYRYIEIYYTDNNGKGHGYTKVWNPNNKTIHLQLQEAASNPYFRQTEYTLSGTSMTPNITTASYVRFMASNGSISVSTGTNYIKIVRVIGRA